MSQDDGTQQTSVEADGPDSAGQQELRDLRERMSVIRAEVAADVERRWTTPWRTPDVFDLKVQTRLSGHSEYRALRVRVQQVEAANAASPGSATA